MNRVRLLRGASGAAAILVAGAVLLARTPQGWGYGEDIVTDDTAPHSTFHYELTRTLARAAGFGSEEADLIAVADEATDTGVFKGDVEGSPQVELQGTQRSSPASLYYHFARRHETNATGGYAYPGGRDTCVYFDGTTDPCGDPAELDEAELWAVYGSATPQYGIPQMSVDGAPAGDVQSATLPALGIYLHILADSYSHEACMDSEQFRGHKPSPAECNAVIWHEDEEFGASGSDAGVPFTRDAARATWLALKWFRQQQGLPEPPLWTDEQADAFVDGWVQLNQPRDRRDAAVAAFDALNAASPTPTTTPPPVATATFTAGIERSGSGEGCSVGPSLQAGRASSWGLLPVVWRLLRRRASQRGAMMAKSSCARGRFPCS
jgi:hypothetical protein